MVASIKLWCLLALMLGLSGESTWAVERVAVTRSIKSTILEDITQKSEQNCSSEYGPMLLHQFNYNRAINGYRPLALSTVLAAAAEKQLYARKATKSDQYGLLFGWRLATTTSAASLYHLDFFFHLTGVNIANYDAHLDRHFWSKRIIPPKGQVSYSDQLWADTSKMGVACVLVDDEIRTIKNIQKVKIRKVKSKRIMVFFDYPSSKQPVATSRPTTCPAQTKCPSCPRSRTLPSSDDTKIHLSVPTSHCPANFSESILAKFNAQRRASNASLLVLSPAVTEAAQDWATTAGPDQDLKANSTEYGQLSWRKWWQSSLVTRFEVSPVEPFRLEWTKESSMPLYTGGRKQRQYLWREWLATSQLGVGCSLLKTRIGRRKVVMLRLVAFFDYKAPGSKAVKAGKR